MTDERRGPSEAAGSRWSVDVLADLHAGVLDEQEAAELWPRVNADPGARAIIEALESTKADLSGFAALDVVPMPADVAARIDAALAQEQQARRQASQQAQPTAPQQGSPGGTPQDSNVVSLDAARARRNKRLGWGMGLLTAAAAVIAAAVVVLPNMSNDPDGSDQLAEPTSPQATQPAEPPSLAVDSDNLSAAVGEITGVRDFGPLGDEQRLDACLAANGIDPAVQPVGFRPATIDGEEAVLVLLSTGNLGQLRLLALAPDCGPDNPGLLMDETVGRQG